MKCLPRITGIDRYKWRPIQVYCIGDTNTMSNETGSDVTFQDGEQLLAKFQRAQSSFDAQGSRILGKFSFC